MVSIDLNWRTSWAQSSQIPKADRRVSSAGHQMEAIFAELKVVGFPDMTGKLHRSYRGKEGLRGSQVETAQNSFSSNRAKAGFV